MQIYYGNMRTFYKAHLSFPYENSNSCGSITEKLGILLNIWNPRGSTYRSEFEFY